MRTRSMRLGLVLTLAALALPATAAAVVATLTDPPDLTATASCPGTATVPCTVVSRTTAIQVQVNDTRTPFEVFTPGRIVGWQISLSSPTSSQISYFDTHEGGTAQAAIAVIRQVRGLDYRLEYESPVVHLERYFGRTATFALPVSVPVTPGDVIALTVPTWAPALELTAGAKTAWRASRGRSQCTAVTTETAQLQPHGIVEYYCIYRKALISYGAIEISTP
jgi:hypothetical protein